MKRNSLTRYFFQGFSLTRKSLDIFIIGLLFSLPFTLGKPTGAILILSLLLAGFSIAYNLTIPVFLVEKQQNRPLKLMNMLRLTLHNLKRLILPFIVLFVLFVIVITVLFFMLDSLFHISSNQNFFQSDGVTYGVLFTSALLTALFQFTPFLFSIEKKRLYTAFLQSISWAFKNINYIGLVFIISLASYLILHLLPTGIFLVDVIKAIAAEYVAFLLISSSLYYYQSVIKKSK